MGDHPEGIGGLPRPVGRRPGLPVRWPKRSPCGAAVLRRPAVATAQRSPSGARLRPAKPGSYTAKYTPWNEKRPLLILFRFFLA